MRVFLCWTALLLALTPSLLLGDDRKLQVQYVKKATSTAPGEQVIVEFMVFNNTPDPMTLVGHLELPSCCKALPANDILFHLMPFQNIIRRETFQTYEQMEPGEFPVGYEVWDFRNYNVRDEDTMTIVVENLLEEPPEVAPSDLSSQPQQSGCSQEAEDEGYPKEPTYGSKVTLTVHAEEDFIADPGEMVFISALITNESDQQFEDTLEFIVPKGWQILPAKEVKVILPAGESSVYPFSFKVPKNVMAGNHILNLGLKNTSIKAPPILVKISGEVKFTVEARDLAPCYLLDQPVDFDLACSNLGNTPLNVRIEMWGDPCCDLCYPQKILAFAPQSEQVFHLSVTPELKNDDRKQFIFIRVVDDASGEIIGQNTLTLNFSLYPGSFEEEDPYIRLPSQCTIIAFGDNKHTGAAIQLFGGGIIDPERGEYVDYFFRVPTESCNNIYQVDQRLYLNFGDRLWDFVLGDHIYALSPLTQSQRYGRGAGIDLEKGSFSTGTYFVETHCCHGDRDPKDNAAYVAFAPNEKLQFAVNYLHRKYSKHSESDTLNQPDTDIISLSTEYQINDRVLSEIEFADNLAPQSDHRGTKAFRCNVEGLVGESTWFGVERIYASPAFYGYYNNLSLSSAVVDFPLSRSLRINLSGTTLKQDFRDKYVAESSASLFLNQRQYTVNASYQFGNGNSLACNAMWLRAHDEGNLKHYNFNQRWYGLTATASWKGWNILMMASLGKQEDYQTGTTCDHLQKYYISMNKQLSQSLYTSLFYDTGHSNYYDAKSWNISAGASLSYRHRAHSYGELLVQRSMDKEGQYEMNQVTAKWYHAFANHHSIEVMTQYFHYQSHYPSDLLFLISYKIPFGFAVAKRKDIGNVKGRVVDTYYGRPVANTLVTVGERQCRTDAEGNFSFKSIKTGAHEVKTQFLPKDYTTEESEDATVVVKGATDNTLTIAITPGGHVSGKVIQYLSDEGDSSEEEMPLQGIRVVIESVEGEEGYMTLSRGDGTFYFENLRPGNWNVRIIGEQIPKHHKFDEEEKTVSLKPKEKTEVIFKLRPVKRKMQGIAMSVSP